MFGAVICVCDGMQVAVGCICGWRRRRRPHEVLDVRSV